MNNSSCSPYDAREYIGVTVASVVSAFISFIASCFVIFLIVLFKRYEVLVQRLILYLSITTLVGGLAAMIHRADYVVFNDPVKDAYCIFAGFFEQHASWMQLDAMACITIHLFLCAVLNVRLEKLEWVYIAFIFFVPLSFNWIPFINLAYGRAGAWCWIRDRDDQDCTDFPFGRIIRFVIWYVPLYLILIVLIILYVFILYKLHRTRRHWVGRYDPTTERVNEQTRSEILPLIWYPLIFLILNLFPLINRIHNFASPRDPNLVLWYLHAISYPLVGALVAVLFLVDRDTRKSLRWSNIKVAICMCCHRNNDVREYPLENDESKKMNTVEEHKGSTRYNSFEDKINSFSP